MFLADKYYLSLAETVSKGDGITNENTFLQPPLRWAGFISFNCNFV